MLIDNPAKLPPSSTSSTWRSRSSPATSTCRDEYLGAILKLCQDRRGVQKDIKYLGSSGKRVQVTYDMPLSEVVFDFFDKLKSVSRGYATLDYELAGYQDRGPGQARHPDQRRAGRRPRRSSCTASAPTSAAATCARG